MKKKHYHVLGGLRGCMPGINYVCETKKEAREIMKDEKEREIDIWYQMETLPKVRITGQVVDGYLEISNGTLQYLEIVECYESDCLLEEGL